MACCPSSQINQSAQSNQGIKRWVRTLENGDKHLDLLVPGIHCAGCISRIEKGLKSIEGVTKARVNLSTKRVAIEWRDEGIEAEVLAGSVEALGYDVRPFSAEEVGAGADDKKGRDLLRALAVAGFAAANIMLLSVSVWSGAEPVTRDLFHWISALIAIPAVAYAGRPFFRSAWKALSKGSLNMDVPISLAVLLAVGMSLYETSNRGSEAFFDASVTLLFFLLIGRYLDHMMRARARSAVTQLLSLNSTGATVVSETGTRRFLPLDQVKPGMHVAVAAGESFPIDGVVITGTSDVDRAMVTGESIPETVGEGVAVQSGTINLTGPLLVRATAVGEDTFLAQVVRLMEAAEEGKARYVRLADKAAQIYAPVVHILSALTFIGWMWWSGGDWRVSLFAAIAVLIITCPCALGLAVPAVQIVASGMLFKRGVFLKDGSALERLAEIDTVFFDKTGTLTLGHPRLLNAAAHAPETLSLAAGLAVESTHPLSKALVRAAQKRGMEPPLLNDIREVPGRGLEGLHDGKLVRIGSNSWCGAEHKQGEKDALGFCLAKDGECLAQFEFEDAPRPDAANVVGAFEQKGCHTAILSGDRESVVVRLATKLGIAERFSQLAPQEKTQQIAQEQAAGKKVLMVGDGINDAPALATAHASIAPSSASDVGRVAADLVFVGDALSPVYYSWRVAQRAKTHILQNFTLALVYNLIAIPIAVFGFASPLVAAIAMSASSILVTGNAVRLRVARHLDVPVQQTACETNSAATFSNSASRERVA
ncbi:MAG: cation-translocating P-type ATPase [Hyphomicrobiales bacterium]